MEDISVDGRDFCTDGPAQRTARHDSRYSTRYSMSQGSPDTNSFELKSHLGKALAL